jgi:thiol-disulfide isomerase/thioredoxin
MLLVKRTVFSLAVVLVLSFGIAAAADRMVIGEMFTNSGCNPCYPADLRLDAIAEDYAGVFSAIRYHVYWPDPSDPFYNFNISENSARINYYSVNSVPDFQVDGNIDGSYNYGSWEALIDNESFVMSPLVMQMWGTYDSDTRAGSVTCQIFVESDPGLSYLRLRIALIEDDINWQAPNGIRIHDQTFRDMIPNAGGQALTLGEGDTVEYSYNFTLNSGFAEENCKFIAFVQSNGNRHILQGVRIGLPDLTPVAVDDEDQLPSQFALHQNYPNPFNARTRIEFETSGGHTTLEVFDITGALINTLVDQNLNAGRHEVVWDGADRSGKAASSGVYFYRLKSAGNDDIRKMALLK